MASEGVEINTLYRVEGLESCKTGAIANYTLLPENEFGKPKDIDTSYVKCYLRGAVNVPGSITRVLQGQYNLEFRPLDPGTYWLDVLYDNTSIFKEGDITIQVSMHSPRVRAKLNFEFDGPGLHSGRAGERTELTIISKDESGKDTDLDVNGLAVQIRGPNNTNEKAQVHRDRPGKFIARYQVPVPGEYTLTVTYDDRKVMEAKVPFSDVSRGEKSQVLSAPSSGRSREAVTVKLQSRDGQSINIRTGGDPWQGTSTGPGAASITITDHLDGTYTAELVFPKAGVYHVDFKLFGVSAQGSPIKLTIN
jgi:hypothetical protein